MSKPGADLLRSMLTRNHRLAADIGGEGFPLSRFETLQRWQLERLTVTFDDLYRQEGYRHAVEFFVSDLYGGLDFRQRDKEMDRVAPVMIRFLPNRALVALAEAFELQALSLEYDIAMAHVMEAMNIEELGMPDYCRVYLAASDRAGRERQILLIRKLGRDLKPIVRKPVINALLRMLRGPAHAAGFGNLQEFLEKGLASFRGLADPNHFVDTIFEREWAAMERLFAGDPDPFRLLENDS
ncbi:MAG: hypothetical protein HKO85_01325 [Xanthomonadales bacterium]|nr:hypothetical protein [Gammaproteobacteria bacterium]MBT8056636.1 hypothetical protein [Gammaproteobacteria bacterium]NNL03898.1 hypothetical protein [Xanthomonadales bacterium]